MTFYLKIHHTRHRVLGEEKAAYLLKNLGKYDGWSSLDCVRTEFFKQRPERTRAPIDLGVPA